MKASKGNPIYTVKITTADALYDITPVLTSISFSEQEKQLAVCANIAIVDIDVNGKKLSKIFTPRNRVIINANDGEKNGEVFRGYVWDMVPKDGLTESEMTLKCYDNLIYWQESDDSDFFAAGKYTDDILASVCKNWGVTLDFQYNRIKHEKLVMRGKIADFVAEDVLATVQTRTGRKYVLRSEKDVIRVKYAAANETVYKISKANNAVALRKYITLNGVITQVVILGTASDDEKTPVEATISKNTATYGTLQSIINRSEDTSLEDAKKEANEIIAEKSKPTWEYDVTATDIPWIRKGDRVQISLTNLSGVFLVKSISRDISNKRKTMALTVVDL